MKILFVASPSDFNDQIAEALRRNGADVVRFNEHAIPFIPGFLQKDQIFWKILRKFSWLKRKNTERMNRDIFSICQKQKPDILFTTKGTTLRLDLLRKLQRMGIKTVNWFPENIYHNSYKSWVLEHFRDYDVFFTLYPSSSSWLKSDTTQVIYLPLAVDPAAYRAPKLSEYEHKRYTCDVCFIGAVYPERKEALRAIAEMGIDLKIFGWKQWAYSDLADKYHGVLSTTEMAKAMYCAKICINSNLRPTTEALNLRTFEIPAVGAFQLCDAQTALSDLFYPGKEVETYQNTRELCEKIRFYLTHDLQRNAIAAAGHQRVLDDHTLQKRMGQMLSMIRSVVS